MKNFKRFISLICAVAVIVTSAPKLEFLSAAETEETPEAVLEEPATTENPSPDLPQNEIQFMFSLPDNMRASVITPGVDFCTGETNDNNTVSAELEEIFANFSEIGLNTVIINTVYEDRSYYNIDMNKTADFDPTDLAVSTAYNYGISPYVVLDLSHLLSDCKDGSRQIDALISRVHRFSLRYPCDGIILDDYYMRRNTETYGNYMDNGSGVGYSNWLYDTCEQLFSTASDIIHMTNNSIAVGFMINDMWANASANPDGSDTADSVQAYYDGYSDTKSFIENNYVDFALLRAYGSLTDGMLPFETVTGWWGDLASDYDIPMYIVHYNEKIGTSNVGWGAEDQLLRQLTVSKDIDSYNGSVFNSYERLMQNPLGTTSTLTSYFNEQINEESLFSELKVVSPAKQTFTTSEPTVTFMGSFDSNFPVYFNNSPIQLNEAGNFYFTKDLSVGMNTFTITHKSKTITYKIERKIVVMKSITASISEGKTLQVDGGTKINLSVKAYKGSNIYGIVNGETVPMKEGDGKANEDEDDTNSSYVQYKGTYVVPDGIIGQEQNLGTLKIYGSNSGYSMEVIGATVIVNAKPEPVIKHEAEMTDANSVGTGEVIGTLESVYKESDSIKYVKTSSDYTVIYDGKTADDIPSPLFSQLPAGTIEPYKSTSGNYYLTDSGKRIPMSASFLADGYGIEKNALLVKSIGTSNGKSYIKIKMDYKTSFNIRLVGNEYYTGWDGDYNLSSFTATHVSIIFENITSVTKLPSFENNMVFSEGAWDTVTEENGTKFRLLLKLRQPGVYAGHGAYYTEDGDLMLTFGVPTNSLKGMTIVIDPGHGYGKFADKLDPGAVGEVVEQEVVLDISKKLATAFQNAGANVVRLKTESQFILTRQRPIYSRNYGCDLYLSIHANKATGSARGTEVYYFTSYSQPLAASISSSVSSYFTGNVYSDGADKNRGAKYSYYQVTLEQDFPSVLVEIGFVDNIEDAMALASSTHQKGIANAIVSGVKNYLSRSSISYAYEGSTNVDAHEENEDEPEQEDEAEETTAPEDEMTEDNVSGDETEEGIYEDDSEEAPEDDSIYDEDFFEDDESEDGEDDGEITTAPSWGDPAIETDTTTAPVSDENSSDTSPSESQSETEEAVTTDSWMGGIPMA